MFKIVYIITTLFDAARLNCLLIILFKITHKILKETKLNFENTFRLTF